MLFISWPFGTYNYTFLTWIITKYVYNTYDKMKSRNFNKLQRIHACSNRIFFIILITRCLYLEV